MIDLTKYQTFLSDTRADTKLQTEMKNKSESRIEELEMDLANIKEAQEIMGAVGNLTQDNTKQVFEGLVTQAVQAVFGKEYTFELDSRFSRGKPEIELFIVENGVRYSPKDEKGGGLIDVIAFALRIVSWAIREPKSQNVMILDEPFRCAAKSTHLFLIEMLNKISEQLGLQIIMITHEQNYSENVAACFRVKQIKGKSYVEKVQR